MVGSNYPPGMSKRDFIRAGIDTPHSHEHEWYLGDLDNPVMEDGAAIFHERCEYQEGRGGWKCEESRTYRFEYSTLETPDGKEFDIPTIGNWGEEGVQPIVRNIVMLIEQKFHEHGPGDVVSWDVDPDPDCGVVTLEWDGNKLRYEP